MRARVWNPADRDREAAVELLVDTGATYTVMPTSLLRGLAWSPLGPPG